MKEECTTFFRDCVAATMKVGTQWCWRRQKQTKPSRDSLVQASCTVGWKPGDLGAFSSFGLCTYVFAFDLLILKNSSKGWK